ncbi:PadR family transcriptional regulator [Acholeplasma sp. OttesenSCG-928-E16]|nr:PadR family transcriptional regulator [Acholeplasma sp. OttesenSCG-928-E16]
MKPQLKKGIVEVFVLAVLKNGPSYGYKIINDLRNYIDLSESTLYPILRRLEKNQELDTNNVLHQGRNRKYYKINSKGQSHIDDFMKEWEDIVRLYDLLIGTKNG